MEVCASFRRDDTMSRRTAGQFPDRQWKKGGRSESVGIYESRFFMSKYVPRLYINAGTSIGSIPADNKTEIHFYV